MGLRRGVGGNMMRVVKTVYVTRAFDLAPAEVSLVDAMKHEMPPPPFALLDAAGELVDEQFRPVSAEEVYLHHAIVHSSLGTSRSGRRLHQNPNARPGADLFCEPMYTFAHGFDSMNRSGARPTTDFGDAKGLPETAAMVFPTGANGPGKPAVFAGQWHVIRTEGVAGGRGGPEGLHRAVHVSGRGRQLPERRALARRNEDAMLRRGCHHPGPPVSGEGEAESSGPVPGSQSVGG